MSTERADQYAAATTESLARLAVEQAARAMNEEAGVAVHCVARDVGDDAEDYCCGEGIRSHKDGARAAFESLVRCVDELARRATEGEGR